MTTPGSPEPVQESTPAEGAAQGADNPDAEAKPIPIAAVRPGAEFPVSHFPDDLQGNLAGGDTDSLGEAQTPLATDHRTEPAYLSSLADPFLDLAAAVVEDLEKVRMANANRLRILLTPADQEDEDGVCRGFGLDVTNTDVARVAALVEALEAVEHQAVLNLQRLMRANAFAPWAKPRKGVGEKLLARLLAQIGDPYWNTMKDEHRTVSQLWAYSGLHVLPASHLGTDALAIRAGGEQTSDPGQEFNGSGAQVGVAGVAAKRRKGQVANWSTMAKTRAYLLAESVVKCGDPHYTAVYKARRAHTRETHADWTKGHSHADGLRIVSKAILKDLWIEARRLHGLSHDEAAA